MNLIYQRPTNLDTREFNWRPTFCLLHAPGCVPGLRFEIELRSAQRLPDRDLWPHATGSLDALFDSKIDTRFILSEIVRMQLGPELFGQAFERATKHGARQILALLIWHCRSHSEPGHLSKYIDAGRQAIARAKAHRLLGEIDDEP